ncbi:hypothetical protein Y1Q_0007122 [Alligator mississippiensis]|uniref:Uncharacterized protein n=1 Tax=Alligator mississippiensis TaxID=8496 RepID=A0A151N6G6_ALLMI|nr:hypothetical protein Y1Q_0007122 [Alligator mississippiensis]
MGHLRVFQAQTFLCLHWEFGAQTEIAQLLELRSSAGTIMHIYRTLEEQLRNPGYRFPLAGSSERSLMEPGYYMADANT